MKGKLEKERNACQTQLVLRQEDGAVRPEKREVLETQQRIVVGAIKASPAVKKKLAVEKKTELSAQRKIQPCSAETKREPNAKRTNCPPRSKGCLGDLRERRRSCPPREKDNPVVSKRNETRT